MIRLLICGSRDWTDKGFIKARLEKIKDQIEVVIEGEARGADTLARIAAEELGIPVLKFPADWETYGIAAGSLRNQQQLEEGKPTLVWAFHDTFETCKGTKDMVRRAKKQGVPTVVFNHT